MDFIFSDVILYMDDSARSNDAFNKLFPYIDFTVSRDKKEISRLEKVYGWPPILKIRTRYYPYEEIIEMLERS